jgi:hypothetical protein
MAGVSGEEVTSPLHALHREHRRPKSLSDPFQDNAPVHLRSLLAKADAELRWSDFVTLLGPYMPAGTYEEVAYFLPLAFDYVRVHPDDALELCTSLVWFCSEYAENLAVDGAEKTAESELHSLLLEWTSRFEIVHCDRQVCVSKGWQLEYFDYVRKSETICETLGDLVRFGRLTHLAERYVAELVDFKEDAIKAAWLLDLIRSQSQAVAYRPPELATLTEAANDPRLLQSAFRVAHADPQLREDSRTYWRDMKAVLAIAD